MEEQEILVSIAELKKENVSLRRPSADNAEQVVNVVHQLAQEMVGFN